LTASQSSRSRVQGIDLLRGVAIALVMLRHAFPTPFAGAGVVGVVMFFTLSGYLISGVLLGELRTHGRLDLRTFYRHRALRLVPALVVMMIGFVLVTVTLDPLGDRRELFRTVVVAVTYTGDLPFHHGSAATFHLWTLATEEQFYLVWPAVLAIGWARGRLRTALVATGLVSVVACVSTVMWLGASPDLAYSLPTSWSVCFVIGAAARMYVDRIEVCEGSLRPVPRIAIVAPLALLAGLSLVPLRGHASTYLLAGPLVAVLTAVLLVTWRSWLVVGPRLLRPLVALGTISYGAYLWNYPLTLWLTPSLASSWGIWSGVVVSVLTILTAGLSWRLVEQPMQRRRHGRVRQPPTALKSELQA
jgi:peptidoglycan/LPS O-acetylase OafA/YrhL